MTNGDKKYILLNFNMFNLFYLSDLSNFQKPQFVAKKDNFKELLQSDDRKSDCLSQTFLVKIFQFLNIYRAPVCLLARIQNVCNKL